MDNPRLNVHFVSANFCVIVVLVLFLVVDR